MNEDNYSLLLKIEVYETLGEVLDYLYENEGSVPEGLIGRVLNLRELGWVWNEQKNNS